MKNPRMATKPNDTRPTSKNKLSFEVGTIALVAGADAGALAACRAGVGWNDGLGSLLVYLACVVMTWFVVTLLN